MTLAGKYRYQRPFDRRNVSFTVCEDKARFHFTELETWNRTHELVYIHGRGEGGRRGYMVPLEFEIDIFLLNV